MADKKEGQADSGTSGVAVRIAEKAHKVRYLLLAAVVVLAAAVAIFSYHRREQALREAAAENKLFQSLIDMEGKPESDGVAIFGQTAKEYEGLPAGSRALLIQYSLAFHARDFATAEKALREFLKTYPKNIMASRVKLALGQTLYMQNKTADAMTVYRELIATGDQDVFPEAKFYLAQALEREAEAVKDNPEEYRRRLEVAQNEYNDIIVRSQITVPSQRGFWPPAIILPSDLALVSIKDRLAGYSHKSPIEADKTAVTKQDLQDVPPPPAEAGDKAAAPAESQGAPAAEQKPAAGEEKPATEDKAEAPAK